MSGIADFVVYHHVHRPTGRHYVGVTVRTWQERWREHVDCSRRSGPRSLFHSFLGRTRPDEWEHHVLAYGRGDVHDMVETEERKIGSTGSATRPLGLNVLRQAADEEDLEDLLR